MLHRPVSSPLHTTSICLLEHAYLCMPKLLLGVSHPALLLHLPLQKQHTIAASNTSNRRCTTYGEGLCKEPHMRTGGHGR
jgi:hypothetical protein